MRCWRPDAGASFRPYFYGYWEYTEEYGWFWVSNEPYGEIVYHYGRWVFDPSDGWLWVPGYIWGPSWVVWRENDTAIGWLPMPPGYADFESGSGIASYSADGWYGYQTFYGSNFIANPFFDLWVFVGNQDFGRSDRRRYVTDREKLRDHFRRSHDGTRYLNDHDHMADRSIDPGRFRGDRNRPFIPHPGAGFLRKGAPITSVSEGREIFRREQGGERRSRADAILGRVQPDRTVQNGAGDRNVGPRARLMERNGNRDGGGNDPRTAFSGSGTQDRRATNPGAGVNEAVGRRARARDVGQGGGFRSEGSEPARAFGRAAGFSGPDRDGSGRDGAGNRLSQRALHGRRDGFGIASPNNPQPRAAFEADSIARTRGAGFLGPRPDAGPPNIPRTDDSAGRVLGPAGLRANSMTQPIQPLNPGQLLNPALNGQTPHVQGAGFARPNLTAIPVAPLRAAPLQPSAQPVLPPQPAAPARGSFRRGFF